MPDCEFLHRVSMTIYYCFTFDDSKQVKGHHFFGLSEWNFRIRIDGFESYEYFGLNILFVLGFDYLYGWSTDMFWYWGPDLSAGSVRWPLLHAQWIIHVLSFTMTVPSLRFGLSNSSMKFPSSWIFEEAWIRKVRAFKCNSYALNNQKKDLSTCCHFPVWVNLRESMSMSAWQYQMHLW